MGYRQVHCGIYDIGLFLSLDPWEQIAVKFQSKQTSFEKKKFENVLCILATILFQPQCVVY